MNRILPVPLAVIALFFVGYPAVAHEARDEAGIAIVSPRPGDVVSSPVTVRLHSTGGAVAPRGVDRHKSGYFILLVDQAPAGPPGGALPRAPGYYHLEDGEHEAVLHFAPGRHTLQAVLGDEERELFDERMVTERIEFVVLPAPAGQ